jgi:PAT family beta-lactamase induction signal transducer AmpG
MSEPAGGWRARVPASLRPYTEAAPLAAFFLGVSSGAPYAMIAATLTTRLEQDGLAKASVTAFTLVFLMYNIKWAWAWIVDSLPLPLIGRLGQRVSWLLLTGCCVMAAIVNLAVVDPTASLFATAIAAILVAVTGATFDIVIDAYRIESLEPRQLGVGSGMSQYGWRIGSALAGATALVISFYFDWQLAYIVCALFALPAMAVGLILGEPERHREPVKRRGLLAAFDAVVGPLSEFLRRRGALLVLLFVLLHKIGDTLANLTLRLLFDDLQFTNLEIATYDVGFGFAAFLIGIFVGGVLYSRLGLKQSVMVSLVLMAVSNLSFAALAAIGHSSIAMAAAVGFENFASGIGGVVVVAYLSALCDLRFTAAQYALLSAAASVVGRLLTGTTAGALIEGMGYVNFYLLTTLAALPGVVLFWFMMRSGLVDRSIGTAATVRADEA